MTTSNHHDEKPMESQMHRIRAAQQRARRYLKPGTSLCDESLVERRQAAIKENSPGYLEPSRIRVK